MLSDHIKPNFTLWEGILLLVTFLLLPPGRKPLKFSTVPKLFRKNQGNCFESKNKRLSVFLDYSEETA